VHFAKRFADVAKVLFCVPASRAKPAPARAYPAGAGLPAKRPAQATQTTSIIGYPQAIASLRSHHDLPRLLVPLSLALLSPAPAARKAVDLDAESECPKRLQVGQA
jgi:hypothetical protein